MGRTHELRAQFAKLGQGKHGKIHSVPKVILILEIMESKSFSGRVDQVPGKRRPFPIHRSHKADRAQGMTWCGEDQEFIRSPVEFLVITQGAGYGDITRQREEVVHHVVIVKDAAITPEVFGILEVMELLN